MIDRKAISRTVAAIFVCLLLVDATIETLFSDAPLRWILALLLAGSLCASLVLWLRFGRLPNPLSLLLVFLGLLAFTAWLPAGSTQGIMLLGQSTSTTFTIVTAGAVLVAGWQWYRERSLPQAVRWVAAGLTLYSLVSFVLWILAHVDYPDLFQAARLRFLVGGRSLSIGFPGWLQGPFVGALLIVPAGLLLRLYHGFRMKPRWGGLVHRGVSLTAAGMEFVALGLILVMAMGALRAPARSMGGRSPSAEITHGVDAAVRDLTAAMQRASPSGVAPWEQAALRLEKALSDLEARVKVLGDDPFDPQAVVHNVGRDPAVLFRWVRDRTHMLPYRGSLKGARGVLMDGTGNSLDRALLVQALLRTVGESTQLARATLSSEQARTILNGATKPSAPSAIASSAISIPEDLVSRLARSFDMSPAEVRRHLERITAEQRHTVELTRARVREQTEALLRAVGRPQSGPLRDDAGAAVEMLRDHWWVQWNQQGSWVDLDPTLRDAEPGRTMAAPQQTFDPESLPADLFHQVSIRVVIEQRAEGRLSEHPVLTHGFRTADRHALQMILTHRPVNWPSMKFLRDKDAVVRFKTAVLDVRGWVPVLTVDGKDIADSGFTVRGEVKDKGALQEGPGTQVGERVGRILRPRNGASPAASAPDKTAHLTAEWIDYEVRAPGEPPTTIRRQVFDLVGAAARQEKKRDMAINEVQRLERGLALFGTTFILPQAGWIPSAHVTHVVARQLLEHGDLLVQQLRRGTEDPDQLARQTAKVKPLGIAAYVLAVARLGESGLWPDVYLSRVNLLTYRSGWLRLGANGTISLTEGFDIVANHVSVSVNSNREAFATRLEQGVADTVAEAVLARGFGPVESVSEIFAASKAQGVKWVTLRSTKDPAWRDLRLHADVKVKIERDLMAGHIVLAPQVAVRLGDRHVVGWWRVDPQTGHTLGIGESGAGQSATEIYLVIGAAAIAATTCLVVAGVFCEPGLSRREAFGCFLVGLAGGVAAAGIIVFFGLSAPGLVMSVPAGAPWIPTWTPVAAEALMLEQAWLFSWFGGFAIGGYVPSVAYCPTSSSSSSPGPGSQGGPPAAPGDCREVGTGSVRIERCRGG